MTVYLFAYGTLRRRGRIEALTSARLPAPRAAVLKGYRKYETDHGYPIILPEPGHQVEGVLWEVDPSALTYIDHYEGADENPPLYYRRQERVQVDGGEVEAQVYVGNPDAFGEIRPADD